ncbi:hypothetical protein CEXT_525331 [Caerostris extrusa]|uniref:Uncharacterized protein n=1 Tax=Caerostris extrusa TaxID=172846 RepID=A0AAV4MNT5_CAEEX|nr:hypothetical protein CEXT_525331 [Caerostris extrusa]
MGTIDRRNLLSRRKVQSLRHKQCQCGSFELPINLAAQTGTLMKNYVRATKYEPKVLEVELLEANSDYSMLGYQRLDDKHFNQAFGFCG